MSIHARQGEVSLEAMSNVSHDIYDCLPSHIPEGSASPRQMAHLADIALREHSLQVAEIGFNTGHSTSAFLAANPDVHVTSFDIGEHEYIAQAKERIDMQYPARHTLVLGDSRETVPEYAGESFDLLFIDGGHSYTTALSDISNGQRITREGATVIVDDLVPYRRSGIGPSKAWARALTSGIIVPRSMHYELPAATGARMSSQAMRLVRLKGWGVGTYKQS